MFYKQKNLLHESPRYMELLIGYICAAISIGIITLLVRFAYLVISSNEQESGSQDVSNIGMFIGICILVVIAIGFSVLAFRLITPKYKHQTLMSPTLLRIWGSFFAIGSLAVSITCIANKKWTDIWYACEILVGGVSMAIAAFALARKNKRKYEKTIRPNESVKLSPNSK